MAEPVIRGVEFKSIKTKYPQILRELESFVTANCKHGTSMALEI